jgi:uncharacterized membrane protein
MKPISINRRKFLGDYIDTQNRERFSEGLLCSGLLLSGTLLAICCLAGGTFMLVTIVCVLILGSGSGVVLKHYSPYTISSCITDVVSLTPSSRQPMPKAA